MGLFNLLPKISYLNYDNRRSALKIISHTIGRDICRNFLIPNPLCFITIKRFTGFFGLEVKYSKILYLLPNGFL